MRITRTLIQGLLHFIGNWFFNAAALYICSISMKGIELTPAGGVPVYMLALDLGLLLTLLNALLRPILLHLLLPLNGITVGFFSLFMNGFFILLLSRFSSGIVVDNFWVGLSATFVFALLNMVLQFLIPIDDDIMHYSVLSQRAQNRNAVRTNRKGIVMLEIDGLSCSRLEHAMRTGRMPFLKEMLQSGSYTLRSYDCGVPSQTSSCQAGIMYGRNDNICAFRWYDKNSRRVFSSSSPADAADMEKMLFTTGKPAGILNNGLSVNNIISGNASENILTVSCMLPRREAAGARSRRDEDIYKLSMRPYLLTKSLILMLLDALSEVIAYCWDYIRNKKPRLNRLKGFYPIVRGATNILLRDISTAMIVDAVSVGKEAMYTTFIGYDEIAHHSGPDSGEAYRALTGIDRSIRKIFEAAETSEARPYEIVILSDHGQSFGATFKQRYGEDLGGYIKSLAVRYSLIGRALKVISVSDDEDNNANVIAVLDALRSNDRNIIRQTAESLGNMISSPETEEAVHAAETEANDILVLASGNLANVYFQIKDSRLTYAEIDEAYPGMITEMVTHPGVGLILVHTADGPSVIGKNGSRNLATGKVTGTDPLEPYGQPEKRAEQLRYLLSFPSGGDLVIISPVYADGTVAAYEELIGSHGGLGGEQTDPFLMHSSKIKVTEDVRNSREIYSILRKIKRAPVPKALRAQRERTAETVSPKALLRQIADTGHWVPTLLRTFYFSPTAYRTAVMDPAFNGPALLITLITYICSWITMNNIFVYRMSPLINAGMILLIYGIELVAAYLANLILRGRREPWKMTRAAMFTSYWGIFWLFVLTRQAAPAWILFIILMRINSLASSAYAAGQLTRRHIVPLYIFLVILIPTLSIGMLLIYRFVLYARQTGGTIRLRT